MKVILPVIDDDKSKNDVAAGFHNSDYVCIYDSEKDTYEWAHTAEITQQVGNLSIELKRKGIQTIISNQLPMMALSLFIDSGLEVFQAMSKKVNENIDMLLKDKLPSFTMRSATPPTGCSSSACASCHSDCK